LAAYLGTLFGLYATQNPIYQEVVLCVTAGGFLYIATTGMVPAIMKNQSTSAIQTILEGVCFVIGVGFMVLVVYIE